MAGDVTEGLSSHLEGSPASLSVGMSSEGPVALQPSPSKEKQSPTCHVHWLSLRQEKWQH